MSDVIDAPKTDRRHLRKDRSRAALIDACRSLMAEGRYRPPMQSVCDLARLSLRSGFQHFTNVENLWHTALEDIGTRARVAIRAIGFEAVEGLPLTTLERMIAAIVFHEIAPE